MRHAAPILALAGLLVLHGQAAAKNPTQDEMMDALRPPNLGGDRGVRELGPGSVPLPAQPAYVPAAPARSLPPAGALHAALPRRAAVSRTAIAPRVPAAAPRADQAPSVNLTVNFRSGSADLGADATRTLDDLGRALTSAALSGYRFRIEGHTDTVGTSEMNKALSERRAAAVADYLGAKWHVGRDRIESAGMGQDHLLVATGPNVSEPSNRRVMVINLGT